MAATRHECPARHLNRQFRYSRADATRPFYHGHYNDDHQNDARHAFADKPTIATRDFRPHGYRSSRITRRAYCLRSRKPFDGGDDFSSPSLEAAKLRHTYSLCCHCCAMRRFLEASPLAQIMPSRRFFYFGRRPVGRKRAIIYVAMSYFVARDV